MLPRKYVSAAKTPFKKCLVCAVTFNSVFRNILNGLVYDRSFYHLTKLVVLQNSVRTQNYFVKKGTKYFVF